MVEKHVRCTLLARHGLLGNFELLVAVQECVDVGTRYSLSNTAWAFVNMAFFASSPSCQTQRAVHARCTIAIAVLVVLEHTVLCFDVPLAHALSLE